MPGRKILVLEQMGVACRNCSLSSLCLPAGLSPNEVELLNAIIRRERPRHRGDYLFQTDERFRSLFVVKIGSVKTFTPIPNGSEQVLGFYLPAEIIGLDAIERETYTCSAKVLETSALCEIPFNRLEELSLAVPALQHQLYRLLSREISHDAERLLLLGRRNAEERLALFLLSLSSRFKRRSLSATEFDLSMSRYEIANYLGLAVETVSRLFSRLQDEGLIYVVRKQVRLLCLERLEQRATGQPVPHINS